MVQPAHTLDAFHRGDFWLVQPRGAGHRAGVDAMMLAAAVPSDFAGRLADFGAGAGAAGLAVASRCPEAAVVLVENSAEMAQFLMRLDPSLAILLIEHDMDVVFDVAQHISVLHFGEVLESGATEQIRRSEKVQEIYLGTG